MPNMFHMYLDQRYILLDIACVMCKKNDGPKLN